MDFYAHSAQMLQQKLGHLKGKSMNEAREEVWKILNDQSFEAGFLEGRRLEKFLKTADPERWHRFLTILNRAAPNKTSFGKNLLRKGGWSPQETKRIYVMSPNGDPDWKKWAKLMPPATAHRWEEWDKLADINGKPLPGKGKLVRIK